MTAFKSFLLLICLFLASCSPAGVTVDELRDEWVVVRQERIDNLREEVTANAKAGWAGSMATSGVKSTPSEASVASMMATQ